MKRFKLFFLIPALMLPLSFTGCENAGEPDAVEETTEEGVDATEESAEAAEEGTEEVAEDIE